MNNFLKFTSILKLTKQFIIVSGLEMYSLHIRKNRKISLYHDTAMEVDMDMPYSVRGSREYLIAKS